jgi:parvulin-like peptidyl-prolyl isomerase
MTNLRTGLWIIAGVLTAALAGCGSKQGANLATVQGDTITVDEFHKYMEVMPTARVQIQNQVATLPVVDTLAFQALQDLISQRLLAQIAKDEGVYPTDAEVNEELKFRQELNPDFLRNLNARGMDVAMIKKSLAQDLAQERLLTKGITVTKEDVEKYIKENPKQFIDPAQADVTFIFVRDPARKQEVDQALAAGETFSDVATRYSQFPNAAQNQGKFPLTIIDQFPTGPGTDIKALINKTPELKVTDWVPFEGGQAKFYVVKKTEERPLALDDNRKEKLRRDLAINRGQQANDLQKRIADRLKEANIVVVYPALKEPWKLAMERLAKEEEATVPSSPTGSVGTTTGEAPAGGTTGGEAPK